VTEEKTEILSEEDKIWASIRHMHMKEAIDKLMLDFNKFQQEHAGFKARWVPGYRAFFGWRLMIMLASQPVERVEVALTI
jgi:hypothetical protein